MNNWECRPSKGRRALTRFGLGRQRQRHHPALIQVVVGLTHHMDSRLVRRVRLAAVGRLRLVWVRFRPKQAPEPVEPESAGPALVGDGVGRRI